METFIKQADELNAGDWLLERDGAALEIASIERKGDGIECRFNSFGMVTIKPAAFRADTLVVVLEGRK